MPEGLLSQMIYDIGAREENGVYHLNGEQTTYYCRIRETDDDFHRMDRQNEVILKIIEKLSKKNLIELMDIVNEMLPYIETNLTNNEIKNYVSSLLSFDLKHLDVYKRQSSISSIVLKDSQRLRLRKPSPARSKLSARTSSFISSG